MRLTDDERQRWHAAETKAEREKVLREVRRREREEREEHRLEDAVIDWSPRASSAMGTARRHLPRALRHFAE